VKLVGVISFLLFVGALWIGLTMLEPRRIERGDPYRDGGAETQ
jgi:hypothetical protein